MWLSSLGDLWQKDLLTSAVSQVGSFSPGSQFKSANAFQKQFYAIYNPTLAAEFSDSPYVGTDVPVYYDGTGLWRINQDAPGANPIFTSIATLPVDLTQSAPTGTATVTAAQSTGQKIIIVPGFPGSGQLLPIPPQTIIYYTEILYTCSAAVPADWVGQAVTVTGMTGTNSSLVNKTGIIVAVLGDTFTLAVGTGNTLVSLTGESGTATLAGNYFIRTGNIVTVYLGTVLPQYFAPGLFVQIINSNASAINGPNWTIDATGGIARDATGLVTVTIDTQLTNLAEGSQLFINATDTTDFPPSLQTVYQVLSATGGKTVFTISNPTWGNGAIVSSNAGGSVYQTWSGQFQIQSAGVDANGNAFITYFQLGPDATLNSTGGTPIAQLQSQVSPGPRNAVLIFEGQNGAQTAPSVPIQVSAVGGTNLFSAQVIPIGPPGTKQRIIAFTPAYGSSYYYLAPSITPSIDGLPPVLGLGTIIPDNVSTSAILDFSDTQLTAGVQIDIAGNNLFNQVVLAPCLGVIEYEGRVGWLGEINDIKNLVNGHFDGGYNTDTAAAIAGTGASSGSGIAWSNPSNITGSSGFAEAAVNNDFSQQLVTEDYGFNFSAPAGAEIGSITVTVTGYVTGTAPGGIIAQLLKAGAPFGGQVLLSTQPIGTAANPVAFTFSFPTAGFAISELNNSAFGVEFEVSALLGPKHFYLQNATISIVINNLFPLGWSATQSTGGSGELAPNGNLGFVYQMTGAGGLLDALISQTAYQDYYGDPIFEPNTTYLFRVMVEASGTLAGNLIVDLVSPSQGTLATATIPVAGLPANLTWKVATFNAELPNSIPSDTQVRIYLQNSEAVVSIFFPQFIPQDEPVNFQQMRISYFDNEFAYDDVTGILEIDGSWKLTGAFTQRSYLYLLTDGPMSQTQNNGSTEPNGWGVSEFADECECFGPNAVAFTEDLAWWAGPLAGVRVFNGTKPQKISQEVQPLWEEINDDDPLSVWVANDQDQRCLYTGVPTSDGSIIIPMSYRNVGDIANDPAPLRQSLSGKMIPLELCRKWTQWIRPMLCGQMVTQVTSVGTKKQMLFGGETYGNLYWLNPNKFTDDDYGVIPSYYTTCFFFNHETEQTAPGLGLHRKLFTFLTLYVSGIGQIQVTPLVDNLDNPWTLTPTVWNALNNQWSAGGPGTFEGTCNVSGTTLTITSAFNAPTGVTSVIIGAVSYAVIAQGIGTLTLSTSPGTLTDVDFTAIYTPSALPAMPLYPLNASPTHDLEWPMNVRGERVALKIQAVPLTGQTDAAFNLQHLVIAGRMDRSFAVRGALLPA